MHVVVFVQCVQELADVGRLFFGEGRELFGHIAEFAGHDRPAVFGEPFGNGGGGGANNSGNGNTPLQISFQGF